MTPEAVRGTREATCDFRGSDPHRLVIYGQGLVEYGLMLAIVAIVAAVCLIFFGDQLSALINMVSNAA